MAMTETRRLTGKQTALVDCLANTGVTITQAAKTVGMTREVSTAEQN
jgi:phosphoribosylpyrophosphate synthetase